MEQTSLVQLQAFTVQLAYAVQQATSLLMLEENCQELLELLRVLTAHLQGLEFFSNQLDHQGQVSLVVILATNLLALQT